MARLTALVVVTRGEGWLLAWPRDMWAALDAGEQRQVIERQTALMSIGSYETKIAGNRE